MKSAKTLTLLFGLAVILLQSGTLEAASASETGGYFYMSFRYETRGNYAAALNSVLQILRKEKNNYTATLRAGWLSYKRGRYLDAISYYRAAIKLAPAAIEPHLGLTLPLMAARQWLEVERSLKWIIRNDPKSYTANTRLAYTYFLLGKYGLALKYYAAVLKWYPSDIVMKLGLAWTYYRMGKSSMAARHFRDVLNVRKYNTNALSGLEAIYNKKSVMQKNQAPAPGLR